MRVEHFGEDGRAAKVARAVGADEAYARGQARSEPRLEREPFVGTAGFEIALARVDKEANPLPTALARVCVQHLYDPFDVRVVDATLTLEGVAVVGEYEVLLRFARGHVPDLRAEERLRRAWFVVRVHERGKLALGDAFSQEVLERVKEVELVVVDVDGVVVCMHVGAGRTEVRGLHRLRGSRKVLRAMNLAATVLLADALHRAILDALHDSKAYLRRGILVSLALTAKTDLGAPPQLLHRAVYTLFAAMPWRLVPDSTIFIATYDVDGGVTLVWESREVPAFATEDLDQSLREGPHGDLVDIALTALRNFCAMRAGEMKTERVILPSSPRFPRGLAVQRRVTAFLPAAAREPLRQPQIGAEASTAAGA